MYTYTYTYMCTYIHTHTCMHHMFICAVVGIRGVRSPKYGVDFSCSFWKLNMGSLKEHQVLWTIEPSLAHVYFLLYGLMCVCMPPCRWGGHRTMYKSRSGFFLSFSHMSSRPSSRVKLRSSDVVTSAFPPGDTLWFCYLKCSYIIHADLKCLKFLSSPPTC
jgi:hypothetical protein